MADDTGLCSQFQLIDLTNQLASPIIHHLPPCLNQGHLSSSRVFNSSVESFRPETQSLLSITFEMVSMEGLPKLLLPFSDVLLRFSNDPQLSLQVTFF